MELNKISVSWLHFNIKLVTSLSFISLYVDCLGVVMVMIAWRLDLQEGKFEDTKGVIRSRK
jgi:hypothetical protein